MRNIIAFALGAALTAVVAALIFAEQRADVARLQQTVELLNVQQGQIINVVQEGVRPEERLTQTTPELSANEPSSEVLRLRGEVGRLRREVEDLLARVPPSLTPQQEELLNGLPPKVSEQMIQHLAGAGYNLERLSR